MAVETITEANFAVFLASKPAVLAVLKPDCAACQHYEQTFEALSQELRGIGFGKATVNQDSPIVKHFNKFLNLNDRSIEGFPATIVIPDRKFGYLFIGDFEREDTNQIISDALSAENSYFVRIFRFDLITRRNPHASPLNYLG